MTASGDAEDISRDFKGDYIANYSGNICQWILG